MRGWRWSRGWLALLAVVVVSALGATYLVVSRPHPKAAAVASPAPSVASSLAGLTTFVADRVSFSYPAGWYAGVEQDKDGAIGGSAGPAELLTFLSDRPFEPLCSTSHSADGGTSTSCQAPTGTDLWVDWTSPTGLEDLGFDRRYSHAYRVDGQRAWIYEGGPHRFCSWRPTTYEVALGIPDDATNPGGSGLAMTACLSGPDVQANLVLVRQMIASLKLPPTHASKPLSALAICRRSFPESAYSAGLVTVGWVRAHPASAGAAGKSTPASAFPQSADSEPAAWCWITGHRWRWELRTLTLDDPNGPLIAISNVTKPPLPPTPAPSAKEMCRRTLGKPVASAGLVTVGWVRAFRPGGPPGARAPAAHAFPGSPATDAAAWCWTGTSNTWTFSFVDAAGDHLGLGGLSGVPSPPAGPLEEK